MKDPPENETLTVALIDALGPTSKRAVQETLKNLSSGKKAWSSKDMSAIVYQLEDLKEFVQDKYWPSDKSLIKIFASMIDEDSAERSRKHGRSHGNTRGSMNDSGRMQMVELKK